ncbi:unnamed protein product [Allacma fusca]|uniref:Uncharacterized protein n=1 Tax=Allacma fusca TaxID=39272 RepID=A0A8J2PI59_9HEXA|nr:unnamed protein product [Allacma fusca]
MLKQLLVYRFQLRSTYSFAIFFPHLDFCQGATRLFGCLIAYCRIRAFLPHRHRPTCSLNLKCNSREIQS